MSWHFSQALEAAYLPDRSWGGHLYAQWKSMLSAPNVSCSGKTKATCLPSQFGTMFVPSTVCHGAALLGWYLEDSHARTFPLRGGGSGLDGERSGLWTQMARIIREVQPRFAFVENSPILTARGLGIVLGDLAEMGFDARWGVFSAADAGARHERERLFIVADNHRIVVQARAWSEQQFRQSALQPFLSGLDLVDSRALWMEMADARAGMDDDVAGRVERTRAIGNGQVPCVAAGAFRILSQP